jgi:peptidoglycan hydrolase-like protein with peptidoglycan-binding domain
VTAASVIERAATTTARPRLSFVTPVSNLRATPLKAVLADSGSETRRIQARLIELGFWLQAVDGNYGLSTRQAVIAFQKYSGLKASGEVDRATAEALTNATRRAEASASDVSLVEIDKGQQLLFIVDDGRTMWVFNTSTGNGKPYREVNQNTGRIEEDVAITPNGLWQINRERHDGWWDGDLGQIYRPKYFKGGIAIHGMNNVPNYPASHGCVRLSLPAMDFIWDNELIPKGTTVWVHEGL